jgi:hypothetical protein
MLTLPLRQEQCQEEWHNILQIAHKNSFSRNLIIKLKHRIQHTMTQPKPPTTSDHNTKWTTFTYSSARSGKSLTSSSTLASIFTSNAATPSPSCQNRTTAHPHPHNPYDKSGIYSLTCNTCQRANVGQTSRSLKLRYQEHTRYIKHNNPQSAYALHILQNRHEYGPMNLPKPLNTPSLLIPYELFFIQSLHKEGKLIPEQTTGEPHPLIQLVIHLSQQHPT